MLLVINAKHLYSVPYSLKLEAKMITSHLLIHIIPSFYQIPMIGKLLIIRTSLISVKDFCFQQRCNYLKCKAERHQYAD